MTPLSNTELREQAIQIIKTYTGAIKGEEE